MKKIIDFFKRLWRLITGKEVRPYIVEETEKPSKPMLGTVHQGGYSFDEEKIIAKLKEWEDVFVFQDYCKANGITDNCDDVKANPCFNEQTDYNIKVIASDLLYKLNYQDEEHYHDLRLDKIEEWNEMREDSDKRIEERKRIMEQQRIDELKKRGVLCPQCQKGEITKHYHGLCEVYFKSDAGGALGGGSNAPYIDANEYQIHYKKCDKCDYVDIFEYRFVPSWWSDLFNKDCPFSPGSPVKDYKPEHYIKYKITRW